MITCGLPSKDDADCFSRFQYSQYLHSLHGLYGSSRPCCLVDEESQLQAFCYHNIQTFVQMQGVMSIPQVICRTLVAACQLLHLECSAFQSDWSPTFIESPFEAPHIHREFCQTMVNEHSRRAYSTSTLDIELTIRDVTICPTIIVAQGSPTFRQISIIDLA